ncbi:longevity assurance proteins LAG1/LAC1 [Saccharata proteae CBS 121410]|uniref:Longevity assurance proteins LAG1/LAC1 n=1 Tax=Saccharata proteae CBS 121410 TaxID=1314787 RepID=A0A9P4LWA4_9PEZI|nr:longevity assurance proteins LAG1/LAC1 [Saccharata proteae CBS 121410]
MAGQSPAQLEHAVAINTNASSPAFAAGPNRSEKTVHPVGHAQDGSSHRVKVQKVRRKKSRGDTLLGALCQWTEAHQIGLAINLILLLALTHICFPRARRRTRRFFELSYYDASSGTYTQGWDDLPFVGLWIVIFTALRATVMDYVLIPLARLGGIQKPKARVRFAEQGWLLIYYCVFFTLGMYIYSQSSYWLSLTEIWTHFPTRQMDGLTKWYYLVQFAFWLQQIVVVNIEERRKDYLQMFAHHIITSALIFMSYGYYQTKVGNVILCIMDVVDIFLPAAKILKYLGFQTICDCTFGIFIVSWFVARHVFYLMICFSIHTTVPDVMPYGCYDSVSGNLLSQTASSFASNTSTDPAGGTRILSEVMQAYRDPGGVVCFNNKIRWAFLWLLGGLQVITLIWFWMIIKVAWRVLSGKGADDTRSDDEEEAEVDEEAGASTCGLEADGGEKCELKPLEEEVGVEGLSFGGGRMGRKEERLGRGFKRSGSGRASGISIPGHGDRKELLGRIGCDKPTHD